MAKTVRCTILGGLPVFATVHFGYDSFTGEYWAEVEKIFWMKKNGGRGKEVTRKVMERAMNYDPGFSSVIEIANEMDGED